MIETILPREKKDYIYDYWREDEHLLKRCKVIGDYYQQYIDNPSKENYHIAMIADYILEGLYFYSGLN
jgi:ribonucleoside-diphosphate reductase beta chain